MQIYGFNKTTLLDYPKHLAATIFLGGCNMRCPFCHNASLVTNCNSQPILDKNTIFQYLNKRKGILEGVCITGGEPTLYPDLPEFILSIKAMGYRVKLDTNGTNPTMLQYLVENKLIDYVAMDIKNSEEKYPLSTGVHQINLSSIKSSVSFLLSNHIDYEFRTTIVKEHHTSDDILSIGQWLKGAKEYYLQSYKDSGDILLPGLNSPSKETLEEFALLLSPYINNVSIRGVE